MVGSLLTSRRGRRRAKVPWRTSLDSDDIRQPTLRRAALGAVLGAVVGAALLLGELVVVLVAAAAGGAQRAALALGAYPLLLWAAGALAGAAAGAVLAAGQRPWRPAAGTSVVPSPVARLVVPQLLFLGLISILLVQVNHRWLPSIREPRSLAISLALVVGVAVPAWWSRRNVGGLAARLVGSQAKAAVALGASLAFAGALTLLAPGAPRATAITPWRAPAPPPVSPVADGAPGQRRLLVLGIDGARWQLLDPLMAAGRLPHLASLVARGRRGILRNPDLEHHPSPVAWTSIFTGMAPERHGVVGWESTSASRVAKALWNILDDLGWRSFVVNVPGTYPAEELASGGLLAGDPAPVSLVGSSHGWWCSASPRASVDRAVPCSLPLSRGAAGAEGPAVLTLRNPFGIRAVMAETSPGLVLWALGLELPGRLHRALVAAAPPLLRLELGGNLLRVGAGAAGRPEAALSLPAEEWSPWLEARVGEGSYRFRLRRASGFDGTSGLFVTPFFRSRVPSLSAPPELVARLEADGQPYLLGGDASSFGTGDAALVETHRRLLLDLARRRAEAARHLAGGSWDALIHVFTVTDRTQHAFWRFLEPLRYGPGQRPLPERVEAFGDAIPRAYEAVDSWLGRILAESRASTLVLVVSDHGAQGGAGLPYDHHADGIYLLAGPRVPADAALGPVLEHVDVLPLVLAHLGLPLAADLEGRLPPELAPRRGDGSPLPLPDPIPTYGRRPGAGAGVGRMDPAVRERLRSLGYLN